MKLYSIHVACKFGTANQVTTEATPLHTLHDVHKAGMEQFLLQHCGIFIARVFLTISLTCFTPKCDFYRFHMIAQLQLLVGLDDLRGLFQP